MSTGPKENSIAQNCGEEVRYSFFVRAPFGACPLVTAFY